MKRLLIVLTLFLGACVSSGPKEANQFAAAIGAGTPKADGKVILADKAIWWPNAKNSTNMRGDMRSGGALVIAERAVLWQQWDSDTNDFKPLKRIANTDIVSVTRSEFGGFGVI